MGRREGQKKRSGGVQTFLFFLTGFSPSSLNLETLQHDISSHKCNEKVRLRHRVHETQRQEIQAEVAKLYTARTHIIIILFVFFIQLAFTYILLLICFPLQ